MNFAGQYYLAMATPGCIELNQDELICVQRLLEVLLCEHKYSLVLGDFTKGCPKEEKTCQKSHLDLCNKSIVINKVKNLWQSSIFLLFTAVTKNMYANPSQVGTSTGSRCRKFRAYVNFPANPQYRDTFSEGVKKEVKTFHAHIGIYIVVASS